MSIQAEVEDLTVNYGPNTVLESISQTFRGGELVGVTGNSGRGKSTFLFLMGLLMRPTRGEIRIDGLRVDHLPDARRARLRAEMIGFVFQDASLDATRTIMDNILEATLYHSQRPRTEDVTRARTLMRQFQVELPPDRKPGQISGGQGQRIALCRALLGEPRILIADEPTGNLDSTSSRAVIDALVRHTQDGNLVLVATHDPQVISTCSRVLAL